MTAETHPSPKSSSSAGDSYLGSLLSLTSKSEIRYEGILINVSAEDASIALRNVKAFGTEGRKMDGPQVPPSEMPFKYILFRASDIKDLRVKSSSSIQSTMLVSNDPAIIQSHYTETPMTSTSLPSSDSGDESEQDTSLQASHMGLPELAFQESLALYQPDAHSESSGPSQPPGPSNNVSELAMPMYGQGERDTSNGFIQPPAHQHSLPRPPSLQQTMHHDPMPASYASAVVNSPAPKSPSPSPLPCVSVHIPSSPSSVPTAKSPTLASDSVSSLIPKESCTPSPPPTPSNTSFTLELSLTSEWDEVATLSTFPEGPEPTDGPALPALTVSNIVSSPVDAPTSHWNEGPTQSQVNPGQLLHIPPPAITIPQPSMTTQKDVEVVQVPSPQLTPESALSPEPVETNMHEQKLPLAPQSERKMVCPVARYGEDFDLMGMNQKFNKDDGRGDLSKNESSWGDRGNNGNDWGYRKNNDNGWGDRRSNDNGWGDRGKNDRGLQNGDRDHQDDNKGSKDEFKPVYVKDDFFDSLCGVPADHDSYNGRSRFSDQMRKDSETFGYFPRHLRGGNGGQGSRGIRGGRGSWGPSYHGRSRGVYYTGGGYDYVRRGRGHNYLSLAVSSALDLTNMFDS